MASTLIIVSACVIALGLCKLVEMFEQRRADRPLRDVAEYARRARHARLIAEGFAAGGSPKWDHRTEEIIRRGRR